MIRHMLPRLHSPHRFNSLCTRGVWLVFLAALTVAVSFVMPTPVHAAALQQEVSPASAETLNAETPKIHIAEGVNSYTLVEPKIFWHTDAICPPAPPKSAASPTANTAADDPVVVSRIASYGSTIRQLFLRNDARPTGVCNAYFIYSNVVADKNHLYWADNSGLVRLSVDANQGDPVELVSDAIKSSGNGKKVELAMGETGVFAIIYPSANETKVLEVAKLSTIIGGGHVIRTLKTFTGLGKRLNHDGQYTYWLEGTTLVRGTTAGKINPLPAPITTGVTGYHAEGDRLFCAIVSGCVTTQYVFIGKGKQVVRFNNIDDSTSAPIYTSSSNLANVSVYDLTSHGDDLFLFENRPKAPDPQGFIFPNQTLVRTGRFNDNHAGVLYQKLSAIPLTIDTDHLNTNGDNLFWMEADGIKRLPNDAEAIVPVNISIVEVHVTQGIQDNQNNVPLIQGRRTFVKVRAKTDEGIAKGVTAFLHGLNGDTNGTLGLPLAPVNTDGTHRTLLWVSFPFMDEGEFLFEIPLEWLDGRPLKFRVEVNPYDSPLETTLADNSMTTKVFNPLPSPRLNMQFYILDYRVNDTLFIPRQLQDVVQTFSWMRRAYPLASAPGLFNNATPGLRPRLHYVGISGLGAHVDQTHTDCDDLGDKKSSCAAIYVNATLRHWRDLAKSNHVYFGLMSDGGGFPRGKGSNSVASGPAGTACCGSQFWDTDGAYTDWYSAHEIGHALGRQHPAKAAYCGHSQSDANFPYAGAAIGPADAMWGFDVGDPSLGLTRSLMPSHWADLMSYCDLQWISDYTYNALYTAITLFTSAQANSQTESHEMSGSLLAAHLDTPTADNFLAVYGIVLPDSAKGRFDLLSLLDTDLGAPPPVSGPYAIRLVDGSRQTLATYPFTPDEFSEEDAEEALTFGAIVEYMAGTAYVQLVEVSSNKILDEKAVGASAPTVADVQLNGATEPVSGTVTLQWTANDSENDDLLFDIFYSSDGGTSFDPVLVGVSGAGAQIDTSTLAGSDSGVLRVVASDGIRQGSADSAPFQLAVKPPQPMILNPAGGTSIWWGQLINLIGEAYDFQDGSVAPDKLEWRNQHGPLGTGSVLAVADLPVGKNLITLRATNSPGLSAETTITVNVNDDLLLPGPTLVTAPSPVTWHLADASTQMMTKTIGIQNIGTGTLKWSAGEEAAWLSIQADGVEAPGLLTLTADPTGVQPGTAISATLMITGVSSSGTTTQTTTIPVTLAVGDVWHSFNPDTSNPGGPGSGLDIFLPAVRKE